ncbi:30S ribosomal protein S2 [Candidatus Nasuia deltocephalinicola]|nr:30S ribosomal protein S2 [Candidatus Nasuia deltocephalinicola]
MKKNLIINEMLKNNIHMGHKKNLLNIDMKKYIINVNKKIHIINLEITLKNLNKVIKLLRNVKNLEHNLLILCVEKKTRMFIKTSCQKLNIPYVNKRWLGGSLTNFITLKSSITNMNYIKIILKNKNFKIKKKRKRFYKKKLKKLESFLNGLKNLSKIPNYMFIINLKRNKNALKEAKRKGVITIGVGDTNNSTKYLDYVIPGNDDSYKSIIFYIKKIINALKND